MPNGPINDLAQVFDEPQVKARGVRIELPHASRGQAAAGGEPDALLGARRSSTGRAPPLLGEHTDEVLRGLLGKSETEMARLRAAGVI